MRYSQRIVEAGGAASHRYGINELSDHKKGILNRLA
jgi:hypothetical protein